MTDQDRIARLIAALEKGSRSRSIVMSREARIAMEDAASQLRRDYPQVPADSAWQPEMPPPVAQAQTKARPSEQGGGAATASRPSLAAQAEAVERACNSSKRMCASDPNLRGLPIALSAAAATLLAVPGVVALLSEWIEGWNGFSDQEIHRRTDQPTYNRIMASRIALRRLTDKQEKPNG